MKVDKNRARRNCRRKQKRLANIRKISGAISFIAFFGVIGAAGALESGAEFSQVWKQLLIFGSLCCVSRAVRYFAGGSDM